MDAFDLIQQATQLNEPEDIEHDCIFYANTDEAVIIKSLCEFLHTNLAHTGNFKFTKNKIVLQGTDKEENCLIDFFLDKKNFNKYYCDRDYVRGVPLSNFYSMFKSLKKKDRVSIWITKNQPTIIKSRIYNSDKERDSGSFTPTCDIPEVEISLPTNYNEPVSIPANELQRMCRDIQIYKTLEVICYPGGMTFNAQDGDFIGKQFHYGNLPKEKDKHKIFKNIYDTQLFCKMAKLYGFSKRIHIYTFPQVPMKINTNIGTLGEMNIFIKEDEK